MTGKERILAALAGGRADQMPVGIDYLDLYLAETMERNYVAAYRPRLERQGRLRLDPDEDVEIRVQAAIDAYNSFEERCDWMQAFLGPSSESVRQRELVLEAGHVYEVNETAGTRRPLLRTGQESKTEELRERFEQLSHVSYDRDHVAATIADHRARTLAARTDPRPVKMLAERQGDEYFMYCGAGAPFWSIYNLLGFENMMMALHDVPAVIFGMMDYLLNQTIEAMQVFHDAGGHGVRVEECFASADIISPEMYERFALPYEEKLFSQLRGMGLKTIVYMCGDIMPRLPALRSLPVDGIMAEESKKDFVIEIGAVRKAAGPSRCLTGNIDVYDVLLKGSDAELEAEVARQIDVAGRDGAFIVGVGSPVTLDTPKERVDTLVRLARQHTPADWLSETRER